MNKPLGRARLAGREDEAALLDLLIDLHRHLESGWGHPFDLAAVKSRVEAATRPVWGSRSVNQGVPEAQWDRRTGVIGVVGAKGGRLVASVGLFCEPFFWFSSAPSMVEIWCFVRPEARDQRQLHRDLFAFSRWAHEGIKSGPSMRDYHLPMMLMTGFISAPRQENPKRFELLRRLWRRDSGAREIGALFARK